MLSGLPQSAARVHVGWVAHFDGWFLVGFRAGFRVLGWEDDSEVGGSRLGLGSSTWVSLGWFGGGASICGWVVGRFMHCPST